MNRIFLITRQSKGTKVSEALEKFGKKNCLVATWEIPDDLPPIIDEGQISFPDLSGANLILSYALHPDVNFFLIEAVKSTSMEKVVLMPHAGAPLPPGYHVYGNLLVGILKPCCVIPPFKNKILSTFIEEFGTPSFLIQAREDIITEAAVIHHTRCGAADFVAEHLVGIPVNKAYEKAGLFAQYFCQSSGGPSGSIHEAGRIHAEAVRKALNS
ncbi:MAG: hypothetical protein HXS53_07850 [Theionarchaea archaeon]|nr:hypothetical protein [Theionarchaea archaeon]